MKSSIGVGIPVDKFVIEEWVVERAIYKFNYFLISMPIFKMISEGSEESDHIFQVLFLCPLAFQDATTVGVDYFFPVGSFFLVEVSFVPLTVKVIGALTHVVSVITDLSFGLNFFRSEVVEGFNDASPDRVVIEEAVAAPAFRLGVTMFAIAGVNSPLSPPPEFTNFATAPRKGEGVVDALAELASDEASCRDWLFLFFRLARGPKQGPMDAATLF
ncbi:hypothetical protein C0584_02565 [Candidatus Parcubacteria bacterium]|nr:MAG: hypothetical protein C0584_02565 [Candidatus Parcubacteria bacterium]